MKVGKVSQTVLKRSLLKPLQFHREESMFPPSAEEMCYGIKAGEGEEVLSSTTVLYGDEKDLGVFALAQVANDLATRGAVPVGAAVHIMLPPYAYESRLKAMIEYVERAGSAHGIQIICAKAETSPAINQAIVYVNGMGVVKKEELLRSCMGRPEQDIVLLKWIALEGTLRVMREKEEELSRRFIPAFLNPIREMEGELFSVDELQIAKKMESSGVGIEVDLKKMAIRQETVEICEYFHLNPYQLTSAGSVLLFAEDGEKLVEKFQKEGRQAVVLGRTTVETARVILGGEEKRYLDRPAPDELLKMYESN